METFINNFVLSFVSLWTSQDRILDHIIIIIKI